MTLAEAWKEIKRMKGAENFAPGQVFSILCDLGVFIDNPRFRLVAKSGLQYGLWNIVYKNGATSNIVEPIRLRLMNDGFAIEIIESLFTSTLKFDERTDSRDNSSPDTSNNCPKSEDDPYSNSAIEEEGKVISFMGIPLGLDIIEFCNKLKAKGFPAKHDSKNPTKVMFHGVFGGCKSEIQVLATCLTQKVYECDVITDGLSCKSWNEVFSLKYGKPIFTKDFGHKCINTYGVGNGRINVTTTMRGETKIEYVHNDFFDLRGHEFQDYCHQKKLARDNEVRNKQRKAIQDI